MVGWFAYRRSLLGLAATLVALATSMAWFPAPAAPDPAGPVLWMNPDVAMSAGKAMAQAGHGAQLAWWELSDTERKAWREAGFPLAVATPDAAHWRALTASGLPVVRDAGFTEVAPGSCTVVADHPALRR